MNTHSISALAKEFGVTTRTIRHYEDLGLLAPARRGQTRVYSAADRTKLKLILRGRRLGLSLQESRQIIDLYDPEQGNVEQLQRLLATIHRQRARLQRQLEDITTMLRDLADAEEGCLRSLPVPPAASQAQNRQQPATPGCTTRKTQPEEPR